MQRIHIIDSHTGGEPTRLVVSGGPDLGGGSVAEQLRVLREQHDRFRNAVVNEPRGNDVIVGAMLCTPSDSSCAAGVIYFNNVGYLGMCGHGTIGLLASLAYMGRIQAGVHRIETPVGVVEATLHPAPGIDGPYANRVSVRNVPSYRFADRVPVSVDGIGTIKGDIAWGGNWFFLINDHGQTLRASNVATLTRFTSKVKAALAQHGITGANGAEIDHIELFGKSDVADSRSFVLCPGSAYDRSPCGTGTSAKLACLYADGKLKPGQTWRQESIVGSVFDTFFELDGDRVIPTITGEAWVCGDGNLLIDPRDPFKHGIHSWSQRPQSA